MDSFDPTRFSAVSDALGDGTFDAVGINSTTFQPAKISGATISQPAADSPISSGQSKFNGWMNAAVSAVTGAPSGNGTGPDGTNPGASAGTAQAFLNWIPRLIVIFLGFVFVAAALAMLGLQNGGVGDAVVHAAHGATHN